ncbi:hypothetical protein ACFQJD_09620 [Haloplanus sp. GCM10025708]|uniref:hypothetical protein n=1 Tax=Haloferacaceae TaxID=1644056 RepID=UPI00361350D5
MDGERQATFGPDGELETDTPPEVTGENDVGEEKGPNETDGGYNRYAVASLLQKAVRRSDEEVAAWAAWELARSGFGWNLWDRLNMFVIEDLRADERTALLVARYEELATERWSPESSEGRRCAIQAALAAARATSSREATHANNYFDRVAELRAEAADRGEDPDADFPVEDVDVGGTYDVALDGHTGEGSRAGRGSEFFRVHGGRVGPEAESGLSARWKRLRMELDENDYTDEQLAHALSPVDPDDPWDEPDFSGSG